MEQCEEKEAAQAGVAAPLARDEGKQSRSGGQGESQQQDDDDSGRQIDAHGGSSHYMVI